MNKQEEPPGNRGAAWEPGVHLVRHLSDGRTFAHPMRKAGNELSEFVGEVGLRIDINSQVFNGRSNAGAATRSTPSGSCAPKSRDDTRLPRLRSPQRRGAWDGPS
jgi:hypothetical protein